MKTLPEREKMPALRMSEDALSAARLKFPEGTEEREFLENVVLARMPYALIAKLTDIPHTDVRDMITGRKAYTTVTKTLLCDKFNQVLNKGLDDGLFPCGDLAVIEPLTRTLLSSMANERRFLIAKQKLIGLGVLPADASNTQ